jgi:hypothetical protein
MNVNRNPWVQVLITAGIVFLLAVLPAVANTVSDGFSQADLNAVNVIVGTGLAAALRAVVAVLKLSNPNRGGMNG